MNSVCTMYISLPQEHYQQLVIIVLVAVQDLPGQVIQVRTYVHRF